tara:strand:+ start:238 stop:846 length:609 start_codon:yes stop_codon:yes gene_type:complete
MLKYSKALYHIIKNYNFYSIPVLIREAEFYLKYNKKYNRFKYQDSNFLSDSIPCPHYFLLKIKSFIIERNINFLCDLGSGYGKILYFFGNINNYKIDGIELDKEIFNFSKQLESEKIKIINQNILDFDLSNSQYDLLIINDPLKTNEDLNRLIQNIKKQYKNKYIVFINIDQNKIITIKKNLNIIQNYKISKNKNLLFCEIS